jgi:hypothetical protein
LRWIFASEEGGIPSFSEPFFADFALQKLALLLAISAAFDDVSLSPQSIFDTGFIHAEVLIGIEHVFFSFELNMLLI